MLIPTIAQHVPLASSQLPCCSSKHRERGWHLRNTLKFCKTKLLPVSLNMESPIDMSKVIPLVTGGGSGIGLGLVAEFLNRGSPKAMITGRRESVLQEAAAAYPGKIFYLVNDAGSASDREALLEWVKSSHPDCNALVNNAGIARAVAPVLDTAKWDERMTEIEINFAGPVHLCSIFIPWFLSKPQEKCFVTNVSSVVAFVPLAGGPVYSATKAAIHNYTLAMRYSLEGTNVRMIEIAPPAVKTNMNSMGDDIDVYCAATMDRVQAGETEVGYSLAETMRFADRQSHMAAMNEMAAAYDTPRFVSLNKTE